MTRLSFDRSALQRRPRAGRRASRFRGPLLILATSLLATGCDAFTFNPPRPPELAPKARASGSVAAVRNSGSLKPIEVILMPRIEPDVETLRSTTRLQAGMDKVRVQLTAPPESAPAVAQAELVREAVARKPPALVIEAPSDPAPELLQAADEARKAGIPLVAVGHQLGETKPADASAGQARPPVFVTQKEFLPPVRVIVADAMRAARNGGLEPDSGAVVLVDETVDSLVRARADAILAALKEAGVKKIEELPFARSIKAGKEKLIEYLKAHKETSMVFAADAGGVIAADDATAVLKTDHRFVIAGFSDSEASRNQVLMNEYAGIVVFSIDRLLRRGVNVASVLMRGGEVADRVEIEVPVVESSEKAALPRMRVDPPKKPMLSPKEPEPTPAPE
jgi:ABC-type sugar transport system substrate-binding protein